MPFGLWGTAGEPGNLFPNGPLPILLLIVTSLLPVWLLYSYRKQLMTMTRRQWAAVIVLSGVALIFGRLFPLAIPWANPILKNHMMTAVIIPFASVPFLLAGAALNVPAAVIVGLFSGMARTVGHTNQLIDIPSVALVAGVAALFMRQNYSGYFFKTLRWPPVSGALAQSMLAVLIGFQIFFTISLLAGRIAAFDLSLFLGTASLVPSLIEGFVGGGVVVLLLRFLPEQPAERGTVPSPFRRSLQGQIIGTFLTYSFIVVAFTLIVAFYLSTQSLTKSTIEQMTTNADAAAARLGTLQNNLAIALAEDGADDDLLAGVPLEKPRAIGRVQRAMPQFSAVHLVDEAGTITSATNFNDGRSDSAWQAIVKAALESDQSRIFAARIEGELAVFIAMPVQSGDQQAVLVGQLASDVIDDITDLLPGPNDLGSGLVVDENSQVVLQSGLDAGVSEGTIWSAPSMEQLQRVAPRLASGRSIYQFADPITGVRQFLYLTSVPGSGWRVAAILPYAAVLRQSLGIMGPVALVLLAISLVFFLSVAAFGRNISRPLAEVAAASRAIATGGGLERPVRTERDDEIGQLSIAFSQMQRALKQRLDELSLLLGVSNQVASTVNLSEGMKAVLKGVLRGTGAAGARAIVRNPVAPAPLIFAEGPGADSLAILDRLIVAHMREVPELLLGSPREIIEGLGIDATPISALYAVALRSPGEFQGALLVGYRQPHYFDNSELGLLRTLAGQASVLVQNAHLFIAAESGRRRLAAILASTTNAVLVTDQTDRVLLVNPAMERVLGLKAEEITGRPVVDVVPFGELARRLGMGLSSASKDSLNFDGKLELEANDRSYLANIATVQSADGQAMGRVAVLQDVTDFVEVDRLKSDFLAGISHDLKSPLTYIQNYASMLPLDEDQALENEYISKIMAGIDRMSLLVNDLVEMAQIQAGINLRFEQIQIGDLLVDIADEYASPALMQGLRLKVEVADDLPPVRADSKMLRRAITNLVTNGLKHAPHSGNMILGAALSGNELVIRVKDNGPGISHMDQAHLFEKFYRGRGAAGNTRGSGLGLAIVKSIADHHKGRIWCESRLGQGSVFYLALPVSTDA